MLLIRWQKADALGKFLKQTWVGFICDLNCEWSAFRKFMILNFKRLNLPFVLHETRDIEVKKCMMRLAK